MSDNKAPLQLHIPDPPARQGDTPDFSHIVMPDAGQTRRPGIDAAEADLPFGLIRALDGEGKAKGSWNPGLMPTAFAAAYAPCC